MEIIITLSPKPNLTALSPSRFIYTKISQYSVLLPAVTGLVYFKKLNPTFRILVCFFWFSLLIEWMSTNSLMIYGRENNMPIGRVFFLVEFLVFSALYYRFFQKKSMVRLLIGVNIVVGTVIAFSEAFYFGSIWDIPTRPRTYSAASVVLYVLTYFYFLFKDVSQNNRDYPMYWLSTAALIYFASNLLWFMVNEQLRLNNKEAETIGWFIHGLLNIIANCLYAYSFMCSETRK